VVQESGPNIGRVWFRVSARYDRDKPRIPPNGLRPTRDGRLKTNAGGRFPKRGLGGASLKRGRAFVSGGTKHGLKRLQCLPQPFTDSNFGLRQRPMEIWTDG